MHIVLNRIKARSGIRNIKLMTSNIVLLVQDIIRELKRLETIPFSERSQEGGEVSLPRIIDAGAGRSLYVSKELDGNITLVADSLMDSDPLLKRRYKQIDWRSDVRRAFGPALANIDLDADDSHNAKAVIDHVNASLNQLLIPNKRKEHAFACTLFADPLIKKFTIGPVTFEARMDWLIRQLENRCVSTTSKRRIERTWHGRKLAKRKVSFDSISETSILEAVGGCPYICSVATKGLAVGAGLEKSLMAAHLATTAIALIWQTPSKALRGINLLYDGPLYAKRTITLVPGQRSIGGVSHSHDPFGPTMRPEKWAEILIDKAEFFTLVGEVLDYVVSPTDSVNRPKMMSTLHHSLLWFHEGCREPLPHIAVVKFAASLDALACGKKSAGIRQMISARLGIGDSSPINARGGPKLKTVIDRIYGRGRSRMIHGNSEELAHDLSSTAAISEEFARLCLMTCIRWAANNPNSDDPIKFQQ
jgi:hypothetical protein